MVLVEIFYFLWKIILILKFSLYVVFYKESSETEQSNQSNTGPGIPDGNENSEKTGQLEDSSSDQRTLNEKSEEIKQSADKLSKQSQSSFGQRTAYEKSNGKVSNF